MPHAPELPFHTPDEIIRHSLLFHGHIGPYNIFGVQMGLIAKRELDFDGHFDIKVICFSGKKTPYSCMADGLQLATGATLGKGNIRLEERGNDRIKAVFETKERVCTIRLTEKAHEIGELGMISWERGDQAGRDALKMEESELFEVAVEPMEKSIF